MLIVKQALAAKSGTWLLGRIIGQNAKTITQASLASISYNLTDVSTIPGTVLQVAQPLTIANVVFDSLQVNDPMWTQDSALAPGPDGLFGYNFKAEIPYSQVIPAGDSFQADVVFVLTGGTDQYIVSWQWPTVTNYV